MRTVGSSILAIGIVLLLPVVLLGWTVKSTILYVPFFERAIESSGFYDEVTDLLVEEYIFESDMFDQAQVGLFPQDVLKEQVGEAIQASFTPDYLRQIGTALFSELDRWLYSDESVADLDIVIDLTHIKQTLPQQLGDQFVGYYEGLPECSALEALEFAAILQSQDGRELPQCQIPANLAGIDTSFFQPEAELQNLANGFAEALNVFPDTFSTKAYFAGQIPDLAFDSSKIADWDEQMTQFRLGVDSFQTGLIVLTIIVVLGILGCGAIHISYWRRVAQWASVPVLIPALPMCWLATVVVISTAAISNSILEASATDLPEFLVPLLATFIGLLLKAIFGWLAVLSGIVSGLALIGFISSFFMPKKEKEPAKNKKK